MTKIATPEHELDMDRLEAFADHFNTILNGAFAGLATSIGHKTGLFDAMATLPPSSTDEIAASAGLDERYVREWLGSMVTSGIVEYDPETGSFHLPPEHAAMLTRSAGPQNFAAFTQFIPVIAEVEDEVIDCFHQGGGVDYEHYHDFHRTMSEVSAMQFDAALVPNVLPLAPGIVEQLEAGIAVADMGCGRGHAVNVMADAFPKSTFVGLDISEEALAVARREAAELGLTNASFEYCDAPRMDERETYDFITTFDAVHDQVDPRGMVEAIRRALKPGGTWLCVDIAASSELGDNVDHPLGPMMYTISCMHCMSVSLAGNGEGLGAMWGEQRARELFAAAGFDDIVVHQVEGDMTNNYYVCRKS